MYISGINNITFARKFNNIPSRGKRGEKIFDIYPQQELLNELKKNRDALLDELAFCKDENARREILDKLTSLHKEIEKIEN